MGGSVTNMAAAPNFRGIDAPVDSNIMQFANQQFAGADMSGRDAYQSELVNQLRAGSYQNPEAVWGAVQANQKAAADAQQAQQMKQLNEFIATAPDQNAAWAPTVYTGDGDSASSSFGNPMTIEQLRAAGKAPTEQGQWLKYYQGGGDDVDYYGAWPEGDGGGA